MRDARAEADVASGRDADASVQHPPGWGIHCGTLLCDPTIEFCCLGATPSCLPRGSTACSGATSLECDDRYDCCEEGVCGRQACCANKGETGPVKGQCGICEGDQVQYLCDPNGIPAQCGGGPTHVPVCAPSEDAGAPRLIPGYPYCVPT
jgi:hypothetical protein